MTQDTLTGAQLNRATLARQLLLARERLSPVDAVQRLAGMQAQEPKHPFIGLWTRIDGFEREDLLTALREREIVRATLMRATLHLASATDYRELRTTLQPVLDAAMVAIRSRSEGLELDEVLPAATTLFAQSPRTFEQMRELLSERFPEVDERALGYAVRIKLALVMVPSDDRWGFPPAARFALASDWLGAAPDANDAPERLARRYLGAFGPASAADLQTWCGLRGAKAVLDGMREQLLTFKALSGRELFDLPDAPRPGGDVPAPVRFLPEFDNLMLAHADRTRVLSDAHRPAVVTKNLRVRATFLCDGSVAGVWTIKATKTKATLTLEPFGRLTKRVVSELEQEGARLLQFAEPDVARHDVKVVA